METGRSADHQLDAFVERAGFEFVLRGDAGPEIPIGRANLGGTTSTGDGSFQAFYVRLDDEHRERLVPRVRYTLHPAERGGDPTWQVREGVVRLESPHGEPMDFATRVKLAVYERFAASGRRPSAAEVARQVRADTGAVGEAYARLRNERLLVLEEDGSSIRMAPPFSGIPTQHVVTVNRVDYFANCAWDALGVPAALHRPGVVRSRCEQSGEPLQLSVGLAGPAHCDWLFHCLVPAAHWWDDIVFT